MKIEIDIPKGKTNELFALIFEGFSDGTNGWDTQDYWPAWEFLESLRKAITDAELHSS